MLLFRVSQSQDTAKRDVSPLHRANIVPLEVKRFAIKDGDGSLAGVILPQTITYCGGHARSELVAYKLRSVTASMMKKEPLGG